MRKSLFKQRLYPQCKTILCFATLLYFFLGTSCSKTLSSQASQYAKALNEVGLCLNQYTYSSSVVVQGLAQFEKRSIDVTPENYYEGGVYKQRLKTLTLGDPLPNPLPIENAEIVIYDHKNKVVQCGTTGSNAEGGHLKALSFTGNPAGDLEIPNTPGTYRIRVYSRAFKRFAGLGDVYDISVKKDPYRNEPHYIESFFYSNGVTPVTDINLLAKARQTDSMTIEGGAFNILNSLQQSYEYIKNETVGIDTQCLSQKLSVYWRAGFNPFQYEAPNEDPETLANTSYYSSLNRSLYISGGQLGDVSLSNTDHFDDFSIIHEFGHFVEDHCGQWTSPGGNHTLTYRIDPRLAWSEGWANFFAAHILKHTLNKIENTLDAKLQSIGESDGWTFFFNSYGFSDSFQNIGNASSIFFDLKKSGMNPGQWQIGPYSGLDFDKVLPTFYVGEGHVREGAISRGLFKLANTCGAYCNTSSFSFANIWRSFDYHTGIAADENPFIASDTFLEKLKTLTSASTQWDHLNAASVLNNEALQLVSDNATYIDGTGATTWPGYGRTLTDSLGFCNLKIEAERDSALNNSTSDPRFSNHFYTIDTSILNNLQSITINFTKEHSGNGVDHDLILFQPFYYFNDDYASNGTSFYPSRSVTSDILLYNRTPTSNVNATNYSKTISGFNLLRPGKYLLNIRAYTAGLSPSSATSYSYTMTNNSGVLLCPQ